MTQGSECGAVGRAVASNTRDPQFESSHSQKILCTYFQMHWKEENKRKVAKNVPIVFFKNDKDFFHFRRQNKFVTLTKERKKKKNGNFRNCDKWLFSPRRGEGRAKQCDQ